MTKKRMIKLLMAQGHQRNEAAVLASGCSGQMPHELLMLLLIISPSLYEVILASMPLIQQGATFTVRLESEDAS